MRFLDLLYSHLKRAFFLRWHLLDRPRVFFYFVKPFLSKFGLTKFSGNVSSVKISDGPVYFFDREGNTRFLFHVFEDEYGISDFTKDSKCDTFVDIGAQIGLIARNVGRKYPNCQIFCFEPIPLNAALCQLNNPRAIVERCAVGSKKGILTILLDKEGIISTGIKDYSPSHYSVKSRCDVPLITIDEYFSTKDFKSIDIMKIDVEGMENDVLLGAKKTLMKTRRVIGEVHSKQLLSEFKRIMSCCEFKENSSLEIGPGVYIVDWFNTKQ